MLRLEEFRLLHQHAEGWHEMQPVTAPHDPAQGDPERTWTDRAVFECRQCQELVSLRVENPPALGGPADHA